MKLLSYLKARLGERSTWVAISAAVLAASGLSFPMSYAFIGLSVIGILTPDTKQDKGGE